jgi:hypothetical protein
MPIEMPVTRIEQQLRPDLDHPIRSTDHPIRFQDGRGLYVTSGATKPVKSDPAALEARAAKREAGVDVIKRWIDTEGERLLKHMTDSHGLPKAQKDTEETNSRALPQWWQFAVANAAGYLHLINTINPPGSTDNPKR